MSRIHWSRRPTTALVVALVLALVVMLAPAVSLAAGPLTFTGFSPPSGPVGTVVVLSGTGFSTADLVQFNGTLAVVASVNKAGTKLRTSVPPLATSGEITVTDSATGLRVGLPGDPFTVSAGVSVSPDHAVAGQRVVLAGSDLTPDQDLPIYLRGTLLQHVRSNENGDFQVGVTVPLDEQTGKLRIYALDPNQGKVLTIIFILGDWPQYRHDPEHTGYDDVETALSVYTVHKLKTLWERFTDTGATFDVLPTAAYGSTYVGAHFPPSEDSQEGLYAFSSDKGSLRWQTGDLFTDYAPSTAVANGSLYLVQGDQLGDGYVEAQDASTGGFQWRTSIGEGSDPFDSSPVVADSTVYVGSSDGNVYALDASTGAVLWKHATGGAVESSPAVAGGIVYVGSDTGQLFALKASNGKQVWAQSFSGPVESSPSVSGGSVFVGSDDGTVGAFDAATGTPLWSRSFKNRSFGTSPAIARGAVYIGGNGPSAGDMYALDASDGSKLWTDSSDAGVSDPAVANGVVYYSVSDANVVQAVDASSGSVLWQASDLTAPRAPIVSDGTVVVGGGNQVWAYAL